MANIRNFIILDLETSGLDPDDGAEIVQIGAKARVGTSLADHPSGSFSIILKPEHPEKASPEAIKIIGKELWEKAQSSGVDQKTGLRMLLEWAISVNDKRDKYKKPMFVGHNAKFDFNFLRKVLLKYKIIGGDDDLPWHYNYFCTMQSFFELFETDQAINSYTLDSMLAAFGIARASENHDAVEDTKYTDMIFVRLMKAYRELRRRLKLKT